APELNRFESNPGISSREAGLVSGQPGRHGRPATGREAAIAAAAILLLSPAAKSERAPGRIPRIFRPVATATPPPDVPGIAPNRWPTVPPLRGLNPNELSRALETARLRLGDRRYAHDPEIPEGRVSTQEPEPGKSVPRGTAVNV